MTAATPRPRLGSLGRGRGGWRSPLAAVRRRVMVACVLGGLGGVVIALTALSSPEPPPRAEVSPATAPFTADERAAVAAYEAELQPLLDDGAQVVALGLRPGLGDISSERYPPDVLAQMADGWVASLESLRASVAALDVPAPAASAHQRYLESIEGYLEVAVTLRSAAEATDPTTREQLLERAAAAGRAADRRFDDAKAALTQLTADPDRNEE